MITIVAEKPDVGNKIAAALDHIELEGGKVVEFKNLKANEKAVKAQQNKDGYFKITWQGQECCVTWAYGHLCELKQAADYNSQYKYWSRMPLPFIPEEYEIKLKSNPDRSWEKKLHKQAELVKDLMNKSDLVINATDCDREGEVIFAYIYQYAGCTRPVKRACFSSQTKEGLIEGFTTALKDGAEMKATETAGRMRGIADWVVGANITAAITLKSYGKGVISVGRVQTPTLAMIVDREKAIRNFKSEPYWTIEGTFTAKSGETFKAKHSKEKIADKGEAESIFEKVNGKPGTVTDIRKKAQKKEAPFLYSLSALQMDANSKYGYTLAKTLEVAQKLYDNGYTTYPRTDSQFLTEDMQDTVRTVLGRLSEVGRYRDLIEGREMKFDVPHYFNDKKVESHFAIIPTGVIPKSLSSQFEINIYDLICRSVIRMLYGPATVENTKVTIDVAGETFGAKGSVIKDPGWMAVGDASKEEFLPLMNEGDVLEGTYELQEKKTEPPKRYSDKTLLAAMLTAGKDLEDEELKKLMADPAVGGIGTEATRAGIIETLINRGYIERKKKSIWATDKGIELIDMLPVAELKGAELTAKWEQRLRNIERGSEDPLVFRRDFEETVKQWTTLVNGMDRIQGSSSAPKASSGSREFVKKEKYTGSWNGEEVSFSREWGGHRFSDEECAQLLSGEKITITSSKGRKFTGALAKQTFRGREFVGFKADM